MAALYISAAHKSSGKTTLTIGICAALATRKMTVQPFKKGPDYIDPIWLGMAAGNPCYNLDFYIAGREATIEDYRTRSQSSDISIIEGNKGLHDGLDLDGSNSNAALAKAIDAPVIMVVDARGTMRGIAPLLIGYQQFDPEVKIAGVIANMTGGRRHETKLREAVEYYTDIPFLGALDKNHDIELCERHLGLIPGYEDPDSNNRIDAIRCAVENHIDLNRLLDLAGETPSVNLHSAVGRVPNFNGLKIGIARDRAFGFYYPADLEKFTASGAELIPINTIRDHSLPELDGLFIGGGFPERHAAALSANHELRQAIKTAIDQGLPTYAECGGLMYLSKSIRWQDQQHEMVGVIPASTTLHDRPCGRGYVQLEESTEQSLWPDANRECIAAHEFHYSSLDGLDEDRRYAFQVKRGNGIKHLHDGLIINNLMATYAHLRHTADNPWVTRFLEFVSSTRSQQSFNSPLMVAK